MSSSNNTLLDNTAVASEIYDVIPVKITIVAYPTTDYYLRYRGLSVDQPLPNDFWNYPGYTFEETASLFIYNTVKYFSPGSHYVEYASSGYVPDFV